MAWALGLRRISPYILFGAAVVVSVLTIGGLNSIDIGSNYDQLGWGVLRVTLGFSAGLVVYRLHRAGLDRRLPRLPATVLLGGLIALMAVPGLNVWFDLVCVVLVFPLVTLLGAATAPGSAAAERACVWLGDVSYPLYGIHRPLCLAGLVVVTHLVPGASGTAVAIIGGLAGTLCAATIAFHWYDVPVRRLLGRLRARPAADNTGRATPA